ncbi:hypothetical protein BDY19DRAFT_990995 [Irpex rosettiformis]|uniref:Uncharacterized protein n=1 Tax=Irpex rosettiformis TaxID=378272 RepID=A0ACB8UDH3_9APHY|nr:hypothetical protein BDY19DRAFT_990995 [Irpex rosettiformis]
MWSRITNVIKPRSGTPGLDTGDEGDQQYSNISVFREEDSEHISPTIPTASYSKNDKKSMFKRLSKIPNNENVESFSRNTFPKKVLSSLKGIASDQSLARASTDDLSRQSQDSQRMSIDSLKPPSTPVEGKANGERFSSIRSILKPNNAPGTGQSVRFFSRDAYRVISPEQSSASEFDDPSFLNHMQRSTSSRPSVQSVFATPMSLPQDEPTTPNPPAVHSLLQPIPPPELGNIFDLSSEELPTIPPGYAAPMLDSAIEISDNSEKSMSLDVIDEREDTEEFVSPDSVNVSPTIKVPVKHDRSNSFSFGQNFLQSLAESSHPKPAPSPNRGRALSDTNIFTSMIRSSSSSSSSHTDLRRPEADINDRSDDIVVYSPPERDPFAANAMTYYTPGTMMPPSPPPSHHARTPSKEEDLIWSLRTQLTLQQGICSQYEADLAARDEIVEVLNHRLGEADKELDRRKNMIRAGRKRVAELERCVNLLEDDVERSREETMDRIVMDSASSEALRVLQQRIEELEREKNEREGNEEKLRHEMATRTRELERVKEELGQMDLRSRQPHSGDDSRDRTVTARSPESSDDEAERQSVVESLWDQERSELLSSNDALRDGQTQLRSQLSACRQEVAQKNEELSILKAELEAQWKHAEKHTEDMAKLKQEKTRLTNEIESLQELLARAEDASHDDEGQRADLEADLEEAWAGRDELGRERDELERQLQAEIEQTDELTRALQEREDRVSKLEEESRFALDSIKRLQENIRQRDAEISDNLKRIKESEAQADDAREGLTKQKREHNRIVDEQSRRISEVVAREVEARAALEQLVRNKAETDVQMTTLKERMTALSQELERLRRQVYELQQESADKEVKLVQFTKQVTQLKHDKDQMNLAVEAKQQEVEMLKRQGIVPKTTTGSSMAARSTARRESSIFGTPSVSRPPSVLSDASSTVMKERKNSDPASTARLSVARTVRPAASAVTAARRIDPPPTAVKVRPRSSLSPPSSSAAASRLSASVSRPSSVAPTATSQRRPSSSVESLRGKGLASRNGSASPSSGGSEQEKENADATPIARPKARRASILVPA